VGVFYYAFPLSVFKGNRKKSVRMVDFIYHNRNLIFIYFGNFRDCNIGTLIIYADLQAGIVATFWNKYRHNASNLFTVDLFYIHKPERNSAGYVLANK
jgi:hypothetical protein